MNGHFFDGATARGGPWPPLKCASRFLDSLLCLSIRSPLSFSDQWTRLPVISFLVFPFVSLHTAFRITSFLGLREWPLNGMILTAKNGRTRRRGFPVTLFPPRLTRSVVRSNLSLRGWRPTNLSLRYGRARGLVNNTIEPRKMWFRGVHTCTVRKDDRVMPLHIFPYALRL
jgi:hypothetical protein